jgi:hypothetical protein
MPMQYVTIYRDGNFHASLIVLIVSPSYHVHYSWHSLVPSLFGRVMYCRRESRFVQNFDVRRQTGEPQGVTHRETRMLMNVSSQSWKIYSMCQEVIIILKVLQVQFICYATTLLVIFVEVFINVRFWDYVYGLDFSSY